MASLCNNTKKKKKIIKQFYEKCGLKTSSKPFWIFKESSVKKNLKWYACRFWKIWQFCYYIFNLSRVFQKFHFPIEVVFNSLQMQKSLKQVFRSQVFAEFFDNFPFVMWHKLVKFQFKVGLSRLIKFLPN